jgi:hypothetical protein
MLIRLISQTKRAKNGIALEASGQICRIIKKPLATERTLLRIAFILRRPLPSKWKYGQSPAIDHICWSRDVFVAITICLISPSHVHTSGKQHYFLKPSDQETSPIKSNQYIHNEHHHPQHHFELNLPRLPRKSVQHHLPLLRPPPLLKQHSNHEILLWKL